MFLEVSNLTKTYKEKKAVDQVGFTCEKGSISCILGPSGCGKTTILRCLGGFEKADRGRIVLNGEDISGLDPEDRPTATVFQSYGLFPHKNVLDNVIYGLKFKNMSRRDRLLEGEELLEIVGLSSYGKRRIDELSGGEQQRVALARSLILKPDLLLLDEPFSNLDAKLRVSMREEIQRIQREFEITMVFVTHDQEDAFTVADKIILMNKGRVEQVEKPVDIYRKPKSKFALDFIGQANFIGAGESIEFLRPEDIVIHRENFDGGHRGRIKSRLYKGSIVEYQIDLGGSSLVAIELSSKELCQVGQEVYLDFSYRKI